MKLEKFRSNSCEAYEFYEGWIESRETAVKMVSELMKELSEECIRLIVEKIPDKAFEPICLKIIKAEDLWAAENLLTMKEFYWLNEGENRSEQRVRESGQTLFGEVTVGKSKESFKNGCRYSEEHIRPTIKGNSAIVLIKKECQWWENSKEQKTTVVLYRLFVLN